MRCSRRPKKRAWPARGWFSGSGALGKIGDLLQALLAVSEKDVVRKSSPEKSSAVNVF